MGTASDTLHVGKIVAGEFGPGDGLDFLGRGVLDGLVVIEPVGEFVAPVFIERLEDGLHPLIKAQFAKSFDRHFRCFLFGHLAEVRFVCASHFIAPLVIEASNARPLWVRV
jgi:hypothetical protein